MTIALDYDDTYTVDPDMWNEFIFLANKFGHLVVCVTLRHKHEPVQIPATVFYTGRQGKLEYMQKAKVKIDVWIDDCPYNILPNGFEVQT